MDAQLRQMLGQLGGGGGAAPGGDQPTNDNAETIHISSLALLKVSASLTPPGVLLDVPENTNEEAELCAMGKCFADDTISGSTMLPPRTRLDAETWTSWCPPRGDGSHAGRFRRRVHNQSHRYVLA